MEVSCLPGLLESRVEDSRKRTFVFGNSVGKEYFILMYQIIMSCVKKQAGVQYYQFQKLEAKKPRVFQPENSQLGVF